MLEKHVEAAVCRYAKSAGCLIRKMNGLGYAGWPDRLFITAEGVQFWIEFKAPGKLRNLSSGQEAVIEELRARKQIVYVVDDVEVGKLCVQKHLAGSR